MDTITAPKYDYNKIFNYFLQMGKKALTMNHYELALCSEPDITQEEWRWFLNEPETQKYIQNEMDIIKRSQVNKIVQEAGQSHSVGQAQVLSALTKLDENKPKKEGPVFIYSYVPLNDEQKFAPNVREVNPDGSEKIS